MPPRYPLQEIVYPSPAFRVCLHHRLQLSGSMDLEDQIDEFGNRRSPRVAKRKKKEAGGDSSRDSSAHKIPKKCVKRKRCQNEDNTPPKKQNVGFKCAPYMLFEFMKQLSDPQKKWVEELGFHALLLMPEVRLPKDLSLWLIDHVDWKMKSLIVRGKPINIKKYIKKLINIPDGPFKVPPPRSTNSKIRNPTEEEKELKEAESGPGIPLGKPIYIKKHIKKLINIPDGPFKVPPPRSANSKIRNTTEEEKELKDAECGCVKGLQDFMNSGACPWRRVAADQSLVFSLQRIWCPTLPPFLPCGRRILVPQWWW